MKYNSDIHHRRSIRLTGKIVEHQWQNLICHFNNIKLHKFIVMPHGIVEYVGAPLVGAQNAASFVVPKMQTNHGQNDNHRHKKGNHKGLPLRLEMWLGHLNR